MQNKRRHGYRQGYLKKRASGIDTDVVADAGGMEAGSGSSGDA